MGHLYKATQETKEAIAKMVSKGMRVTDIAQACGVSRTTVWRVKRTPEFKAVIQEERLGKIDKLEDELDKISFDPEIPAATRLKAIMCQLAALDPDKWDSHHRRRAHEAELSHNYNPRVQYQRYMDERDRIIQEENAKKALEARQGEQDDPNENVVLEHVILDLRRRRIEAAKIREKEADDYDAKEEKTV